MLAPVPGSAGSTGILYLVAGSIVQSGWRAGDRESGIVTRPVSLAWTRPRRVATPVLKRPDHLNDVALAGVRSHDIPCIDRIVCGQRLWPPIRAHEHTATRQFCCLPGEAKISCPPSPGSGSSRTRNTVQPVDSSAEGMRVVSVQHPPEVAAWALVDHDALLTGRAAWWAAPPISYVLSLFEVFAVLQRLSSNYGPGQSISTG
jgi:hypothetical protein